jgi:hypothetical protein
LMWGCLSFVDRSIGVTLWLSVPTCVLDFVVSQYYKVFQGLPKAYE